MRLTNPALRGDRLREARRAREMTQGELATRIGVSRTQVTNAESGLTDMSATHLALTAFVLGVSTDWLLDLSSMELPAGRQLPDEPLPFDDVAGLVAAERGDEPA